MIDHDALRRLIALALEEDIGSGDVTTCALISSGRQGEAFFLAKQDFVVCGGSVVEAVFAALDTSVCVFMSVPDGTAVISGAEIGLLAGPLASILTGERVALNFLQRLSGIATKVSKITSSLTGTQTKLFDTRKTTPGWRHLEKYAVTVGGGVNHRYGLYDAFLVKNNHIDALSGDICSAVRACRELPTERPLLVEVEVRTTEELRQALAAGVDRVLLDNMTPEQVRSAVVLVRQSTTSRGCTIEASGGITEHNVRSYAEAGVDFVSLGSVTHSATAVDISLRIRRWI